MQLTPPSLTFEMQFNPVSPFPGSGPSELKVQLKKGAVHYARFSNTQNPNYIRPGTEWVHTPKYTPAFASTANSYVARLSAIAASLESVPANGPERGWTRNGRFQLSLGERTWHGSMRDARGPVRDAVEALRSLARDLKRGVDGGSNPV